MAKFIAATTSGCAPILLNFTDQSTGDPTQWKWDLGNGTVSYLQNPSVTYFDPGLYTVKLTVTNSGGEDSIVQINYITVFGAPLVNFTSSQTTGCNSLTVNFTDQTTSGAGNIGSWQWDFGDGILSTSHNPSHTYDQTGNYNVSLKAGNSNGCTGNLLKASYIKINGIKAGFTNAVSSRCMPTAISFQNTSSGNGLINYRWLFGNGDSSNAANPLHSFPNGGGYTVRLFVNNQYGCADSVIKNIRVDTPVSAAFTASITAACKAPAEVNFTNQVKLGNTYSWDFGDSTAGHASSPAHLFSDTGIYTVKLIVKNINGCVDSLTKDSYIKIQKPYAAIDNLPDSGCGPFTKRLSVSPAGTDSIISYLWSFDDGGSSIAKQPTHTFYSAGYHAISLITRDAAGCSDTMSMQKAIRVSNKPVADFSASLLNTCANKEVSFTDLTTGGVNEWQWFFGDNSQAAEQNPKHVFTDTGFINVSLLVSNGGCMDTATKTGYVYIKPAIAKFKFLFTCASPFVYSFSNFSQGADQWTWNFGDGTTSSQLNPVHTYSDTGTYNTSLTAYNQTTGCVFYEGKTVKIVKIVSDFFASDSIICKGSATTFRATLPSEQATRFIWYFGDGTYKGTTENTITHVYERAGAYTVQLVIANLINCRDSVVKQQYIRVNGPAAYFRTPVTGSCANTPVFFRDSSVTDGLHAIRSWKWNFGDGTTETLLAPPFSHRYSNTGNYTTGVTVTDASGCADTFVAQSPVLIKKLIPYFASYDTVSCTNKEIAFAAPYAEAGVSYRWDFGDGGSAAVQAPRHSYSTEGLYTVKMVISHTLGCSDSSIRTNYINIKNPVAQFIMSDSFRTCPPLVIAFTNMSVNTADEQWDFGDGTSTVTHNPSHFYSYPGTYIATLTVKGIGGCIRQMQKQITVKGPKGTLSYNPLSSCAAHAVNFGIHSVDAISYTWDFNDGVTIVTSDSAVVHSYSNGGKFIPKIILADDNGCKVPVNGNDTINQVIVSANFNFPSGIICGNQNVFFRDSSACSENIDSYYWNFGDNSHINSDANPVHRYDLPGSYFPSLKIRTASGCTDSFYSAMPVNISAVPMAVLRGSSGGCVPLLTDFSSTPDTSAVQWHWDFGNGNASTAQTPPPQMYSAAGAYAVTLTAASRTGCENRSSTTVHVYSLPSIQIAGDSIICKGKNTRLVVNNAGSYTWNTARGLSCSDCASPLAGPDSTITYMINAVSANGCRARDSVTVRVVQPFKMSYNAAAAVCAGKPVPLHVEGALFYKWSPAEGLDNIFSSQPLAQPEHNITYMITGSGEKGCFKDTGYIAVSVNALPSVNAGEDIKITAGSPADLIPAVSADVTAVNWSPTEGLFRNSGNNITVRPLSTTEYIVEVKNAAGCTAKDKVNVIVLNAAGDVFVPNSFSPNNDGSNDVFYPRSAGAVKIKRLKIFNRAGVSVFERMDFYSNDISAGWDGTCKGIKLSANIFIYAIEIAGENGKSQVITGNVALLQ